MFVNASPLDDDPVRVRDIFVSADSPSLLHGSLTRYVKLRVAHASGMPGTFSPPPTSKETAS